MKDIKTVVEELNKQFSNRVLDIREIPLQETVIEIAPTDLREITTWLLENSNFYHLSTITGVDDGEQIELYYHYWDGEGLSLCIELPRENPSVDTITDMIPGAAFYEREVFEMLGVKFENLKDMRRLLMADDWDGKDFPLRAEEKRIDKEEKR